MPVEIPPFALLFPGQGAQAVGMAKEVSAKYPKSREIFKTADEITGIPISRLCFEGPEDELNLTVNCQPAILTASLGLWEAVKCAQPGLIPKVTCGLSLGEFSALVAAGVLTFEAGLRLVRKRGQWMHEAGEASPGAMCSVIGLDTALCEQVAAESGTQIANYNSPGQIVLSGKCGDIEKAMEIAKAKGARKIMPLKVSGAFHSSLMAPAQQKLSQELEKVRLGTPCIDFICNVKAEFVRDPEDIRLYLGLQVTHSVRWFQTLELLFQRGIRHAIEIGPGKVLKGLAKRTIPDFSVHNIETLQDIAGIDAFFSNTQSPSQA